MFCSKAANLGDIDVSVLEPATGDDGVILEESHSNLAIRGGARILAVVHEDQPIRKFGSSKQTLQREALVGVHRYSIHTSSDQRNHMPS